MLLALLLSIAADTTTYVVLNHGRPAGEMLVITTADTTTVKYHHVDRNRGPRSETRYVFAKGRPIRGEVWTLPLNEPDAPKGEPVDRFEVVRDSVLWRARDSTRRALYAPTSYYRLRSFTPFDLALTARVLLDRPDRSAQLVPTGTVN